MGPISRCGYIERNDDFLSRARQDYFRRQQMHGTDRACTEIMSLNRQDSRHVSTGSTPKMFDASWGIVAECGSRTHERRLFWDDLKGYALLVRPRRNCLDYGVSM